MPPRADECRSAEPDLHELYEVASPRTSTEPACGEERQAGTVAREFAGANGGRASGRSHHHRSSSRRKSRYSTKPLRSERVDELQQRPQRRARGEDTVECLGESLVFAFVVKREHHDVLELRGKFRRGSVNRGMRHGLAPALTDLLGELPVVVP
jgi:hypothetical protein